MATKRDKARFARQVKEKAAELIKLIDSAAASNNWSTVEFRKWNRLQAKAKKLVRDGAAVAVEAAEL